MSRPKDDFNLKHRAVSVGSDRELEDINQLHSFSSVNFKNKLETKTMSDLDLNGTYTVPGNKKPPRHATNSGRDGDHQLSQPSTSGSSSPERKPTSNWSFDSPTRQNKGERKLNIDKSDQKLLVSRLPLVIRVEANISGSTVEPTSPPKSSNLNSHDGGEMNTANPYSEFHSSVKSSRTSGGKKKSKKHKHRTAEDEVMEDLYEDLHKLKKRKSKQESKEESWASTETYTADGGHDNKAYYNDKLPPKPTEKDDNQKKLSRKRLSNLKQTAKFINDNIKQLECNKYARNFDAPDYECQCGRSADWHGNKVDKAAKEVWRSKTHTKKQACDSFGEITFRGFGHKNTTNSPYVRLDPATNLNDVWEILIEHWALPLPKLLISVTGGAKEFELKARLRTVLKQGLIHAAKSTGAWIVTGGTAAGVMEFVGEAVRDHIFSTRNPEQNKVVALGIASWGVINNNLALDGEGPKGLFPATYAVEDTVDFSDGTPLDHNHTHFLLVDNGTDGKYGGEIEFRSKLESYISQKVETGVAKTQSVHVPCVLLVVEGGINTMKTVLESLRRKTPVVVIDGTGRCADLIAYGFKITKKKNDDEQSRKNKEIDETLKEMTRKLLFDGKHTDKINNQIANIVTELNECLVDRRLVNVFSLERADVKEIDRAILYALLKANKSKTDSQLALALAWNRCDIARQEIFTAENRQKWDQTNLYDAMITALVQDRTDFVQSFLDNGVDFRKFLTKHTLWNIYYLTMSEDTDPNGDVFRYLRRYIKQTWFAYITCKCIEAEENTNNLLRTVSKIMVRLMKDTAMDLYKGDKYKVEGVKLKAYGMKWLGDENTLKCLKSRMTEQKGSNVTIKKKKIQDVYEFEHPARELFIWAILFNRRNMAHLFWKLGHDQLGAAVVACSLLKGMAKVAEQEDELELSIDLYDHANGFEKLATNVLAECYGRDKRMAQQLLIREQILWGKRTIFEIANNNTLMDFLEHSCCQTKLNTVWKGTLALYTSEFKVCICILLPILLPLFIKFSAHKSLEDIIDEDDDDEESEDENDKKDDDGRPHFGNKITPGTSNNPNFTPAKSRRGKRVKKKTYAVDCFKCGRNNINIISALVFFYSAPVTKFYTGLLSYLVFLGIFTYFVMTDLRPVSEPDSPSLYEYITWIWLSTMIVEELRQIWVLDQPLIYKLRNWWIDSIWNRFDLAMYMLFILSVILRYTIFTCDFLWARIFYSITLAMFYLRLMQSFFVAKNMGPKVIMIGRMLTDLFFFFLILLVFIMSFGIAYQVNLYPNSPLSWVLVKNILYLPYWQMYGELFLKQIEGEEDPDKECTNNERIWRKDLSLRCPQTNAFVPILLAIYMILTNILLVNLLIAMFSYTFQTIQDNSLKMWRYYRLALVQEIFYRPFLVPPLIILNHLYRIIIVIINKTCWIIPSQDDFKEKLTKEENLRLSLFERGSMENYLSHRLMRERDQLDNKVSSTALRIEYVMDDLAQIKDTITDLDNIYNKLVADNPTPRDGAVVSARPQGTDEVAYLRCIDDLSEQMSSNTLKINQMMKLMEGIIRKDIPSYQTMDMDMDVEEIQA